MFFVLFADGQLAGMSFCDDLSSVRSDLGSFGLGRVDLSGFFLFYLRCEENQDSI